MDLRKLAPHLTDGEVGTHDALLGDILANPDDNDLRLIYADWIEDHIPEKSGGKDRARFIRLQIEQWKWVHQEPSVPVYIADMDKRNDRMAELQKLFQYGDVRGDVGLPLTAMNGYHRTICLQFTVCVTKNQVDQEDVWRFRWFRGFMGSVHTSWDRWLQYGPALMAACPVQYVKIHDAVTAAGFIIPSYFRNAIREMIHSSAYKPYGFWRQEFETKTEAEQAMSEYAIRHAKGRRYEPDTAK